MDNRKRKLYTKDDMSKAFAAVQAGMPVATASKSFGVPRITLRNKVKGISPVVCTMGPSTILTTVEEERIAQWVVDVAKAGFPITKTALFDTVAKLIKEMNRETPFTDGRPGRKWFNGFLKRHPSISLKTAEKLTGYRGQLSEAQIRNWFSEVLTYLEENKYTDVLEEGDRIFNADETAFALCPKTGKVLAPRGEKNIYDVSKTSDKEHITVLFTVSGSGKIAPPMPVFPYKRLPADIVRTMPKGWGVGKSDSGWMTGEVFYEYMGNVFEPWLTEQNIKRPVIFFVDGHKSHLTMQLSVFLKEKQIILVALHPNATHVLQPLDVAVFFPLKCKWKAQVRKWLMDHEYEHVTKQNMSEILATVIKDGITENMIKNGFRVCGLFPFNPDGVDYSKCITKTHHESDNKNKVLESHKSFLESLIPHELLTEMQGHDVNMEWNGQQSARDLYNVWRQIKKMSGTLQVNLANQTIIHDVVDSNQNPAFASTVCGDTTAVGQPNAAIAPSGTSPAMSQPTTANNLDDLYYTNHTPKKLGADHFVLESNQSAMDSPTSPFRRVLFWPKEQETVKRNKIKEKVPAVVTSDIWQNYYKKKEYQKVQKQKDLETRKRAREEKKKEKTEFKKRKGQTAKSKGARTKSIITDEKTSWTCFKCQVHWKEKTFLSEKQNGSSAFHAKIKLTTFVYKRT